jgi:hypothetical protein
MLMGEKLGQDRNYLERFTGSRVFDLRQNGNSGRELIVGRRAVPEFFPDL